MRGADFADLLETLGFDFFAGVPCSLVEGTVRALEGRPEGGYVPAVREDVAIGLAAGAWLGGRRPAVLMQNSGLGTGLNALASLALLYRLPSLLVVTWRGRGPDAPEHVLTGAVTPRLLDLFGIRHRLLEPDGVADALRWARDEAEARMEPVAVLVPPRLLASDDTKEAGLVVPDRFLPASRSTPALAPLTPTLSRLEALRAAVGALDGEPVIHANGYICRESFAVADRPGNFYMIGSMGLASAIGLGLALVRPDLRVVVFDGDGNALMSLGTLALAGALAPANLLHVVFDNEVYGSTGGQRSVSREVRLDAVAAAAGYGVRAAARADDLRDAMRAGLDRPGPHFVLAKVTAQEAEVPRIPYRPEAIRDRFRSAIGGR